jgi:hypothetical protein
MNDGVMVPAGRLPRRFELIIINPAGRQWQFRAVVLRALVASTLRPLARAPPGACQKSGDRLAKERAVGQPDRSKSPVLISLDNGRFTRPRAPPTWLFAPRSNPLLLSWNVLLTDGNPPGQRPFAWSLERGRALGVVLHQVHVVLTQPRSVPNDGLNVSAAFSAAARLCRMRSDRLRSADVGSRPNRARF